MKEEAQIDDKYIERKHVISDQKAMKSLSGHSETHGESDHLFSIGATHPYFYRNPAAQGSPCVAAGSHCCYTQLYRKLTFILLRICTLVSDNSTG